MDLEFRLVRELGDVALIGDQVFLPLFANEALVGSGSSAVWASGMRVVMVELLIGVAMLWMLWKVVLWWVGRRARRVETILARREARSKRIFRRNPMPPVRLRGPKLRDIIDGGPSRPNASQGRPRSR